MCKHLCMCATVWKHTQMSTQHVYHNAYTQWVPTHTTYIHAKCVPICVCVTICVTIGALICVWYTYQGVTSTYNTTTISYGTSYIVHLPGQVEKKPSDTPTEGARLSETSDDWIQPMIEVQNCCHQYGHIKFQIQMSEQQMSPELYTYNHQIDLNMSGASGNWWGGY